MAYRFEKTETGTDIVIDGWEKGIGDAPYGQMSQFAGFTGGLADLRNVNIITSPGEASVNFATALNSLGSFSATVASADASADTVTYSSATGTPQSGMAVVFAGGSLPTGITAGTQSASADTNVYWIGNINTSAQTFKVYSDPTLSSLVNITNTGTGTVASINMTQPRHWTTVTSAPNSFVYYIVDSVGRVWYQNGTSWVFVNNTTRANANGNGLVYFQASNGTGYLFVFRNALIDYMPTATIGTWTYGWKTMNTAAGTANSHHALVGQDNVAYYCDGAWLGSFFEKSGQNFDPSSGTTFTWTQQALALPTIEIAQWLAELGVSLLVAGVRNLIFPWDRTSTSFNYPIFMADTFGYGSMASAQPNVPKMMTINTNTYIFMGNRGRIYITNGSQAQLFKKVPDFLSGTVEPYFTWGGVGFNKNQMYFGILATSNDGTANNNFGGLWAIDMDTNALRLVNQLSYGSYAGYCTLYIPLTTTATGFGFYAGWDNNASGYGIDSSSSSPYTGGQSYAISDAIPIGNYLSKYTPTNIEYKLSVPMVSGESVQLLSAQHINDTYTSIGTDSTVGNISFTFPFTDWQFQWLLIKAVLTSTASSPSYARLKEVRIHMT